MKLRIALKICRHFFDHSRDIRSRIGPKYRYSTSNKAIRIGRKYWRDERFPLIPSDDQLEEEAEIRVAIFAGLAKSLGCQLPPGLDAIAIDFKQFNEIQ